VSPSSERIFFMRRAVKPPPPRTWFMTIAGYQSGSERRRPGKAHWSIACGASLSTTWRPGVRAKPGAGTFGLGRAAGPALIAPTVRLRRSTIALRSNFPETETARFAGWRSPSWNARRSSREIDWRLAAVVFSTAKNPSPKRRYGIWICAIDVTASLRRSSACRALLLARSSRSFSNAGCASACIRRSSPSARSFSWTWRKRLPLVSPQLAESVAARASRRSSTAAASRLCVPATASCEPKRAARPSLPAGSRYEPPRHQTVTRTSGTPEGSDTRKAGTLFLRRTFASFARGTWNVTAGYVSFSGRSGIGCPRAAGAARERASAVVARRFIASPPGRGPGPGQGREQGQWRGPGV
jgi:hypothetical protein